MLTRPIFRLFPVLIAAVTLSGPVLAQTVVEASPRDKAYKFQLNPVVTQTPDPGKNCVALDKLPQTMGWSFCLDATADVAGTATSAMEMFAVGRPGTGECTELVTNAGALLCQIAFGNSPYKIISVPDRAVMIYSRNNVECADMPMAGASTNAICVFAATAQHAASAPQPKVQPAPQPVQPTPEEIAAAIAAQEQLDRDIAAQKMREKLAALQPYRYKLEMAWSKTEVPELSCFSVVAREGANAGANGFSLCLKSWQAKGANGVVVTDTPQDSGFASPQFCEDIFDGAGERGLKVCMLPAEFRMISVSTAEAQSLEQRNVECVALVFETSGQPRDTGHKLRAVATEAQFAAAGGVPAEQVKPAPTPVAATEQTTSAAEADAALIEQRRKAAEEKRRQVLADAALGIDVIANMDGLTWHADGAANGQCEPFHDVKDAPAPLGDNYLCGEATKYLHFSSSGKMRGMRCARVYEPASPNWHDNYLCTPYKFPYTFKFSVFNEIHTLAEGGKCLDVRDYGARGWGDNWLCWEPNAAFLSDQRAKRVKDAEDKGVTLPLGPVTTWTEVQMTEYLEKVLMDEALSAHTALFEFMDSLSPAERSAFSAVLSNEQRGGYVDWHEMELTWSLAPLTDKVCTELNDVDANAHSVWLCANRDFGLRWSITGPIDGMRCILIRDHPDADKAMQHYLCLPGDSDYHFKFFVTNSIDGIQDKCISTQLNSNYWHYTDWNDNWLCYDRHKLVSMSGHWEPAAAPCPSCPEVDYAVSYGVEQGQENSQENTFSVEVTVSTEVGADIGPVSVSENVSVSTGFSHSWSVAKSFSQSRTDETSIPCHLGAVWQWVTTAVRDCAFGHPCPAITARSEIIQCTVADDEPVHTPYWTPCEPIFVDNLSATPIRRQNAGTRSDTPGGWRCRGDSEIVVEQATYGRSCNAPVGNVTDYVAMACQRSDPGLCTFDVDMGRLGRSGGEECDHNFEVYYSCPGDNDQLRSAFIDGEAGHKTNVALSCGDDTAQIIAAAAAPETAAEAQVAEATEDTPEGEAKDEAENATAEAIKALADAIASQPASQPASQADSGANDRVAQAIESLTVAISARPTDPPEDKTAELRGAMALERIADLLYEFEHMDLDGIEEMFGPDPAMAQALAHLGDLIARQPQTHVHQGDAQVAAAIQTLARVIQARPSCAVAATQCATQTGYQNNLDQTFQQPFNQQPDFNNNPDFQQFDDQQSFNNDVSQQFDDQQNSNNNFQQQFGDQQNYPQQFDQNNMFNSDGIQRN